MKKMITFHVALLLSTVLLGQDFFKKPFIINSQEVSDNSLVDQNKTNYQDFPVIYTPPSDDYIYIDFVGSGDIQKSLTDGAGLNGNTGMGVILERYNGTGKIIQSLELESTINIATTADTIVALTNNASVVNKRDFGSYLLNPISRNQSLYLNSNIYFGYPQNTWISSVTSVISGVNFRLISSNNVWNYNGSSYNLGALLFRAGIFHEFIPDNFRVVGEGEANVGRSIYSIFLGLNYSSRRMFGDLTFEENATVRNEVLGAQQLGYRGVELNFGFRLNNLRAEFQMPVLKTKDKQVLGLTDTQFLFSIKFVGGFTLKLEDAAKKTQNTGND